MYTHVCILVYIHEENWIKDNIAIVWELKDPSQGFHLKFLFFAGTQ